jgi:C4-dicarboxylate-specific signal transduction histidine kinase
MDQVQFYEEESVAKAAVKSAELIQNTMSSWVNRVILIALQVTVTICVFEGLRDLIPQIAGPGYNIFLTAVVCAIVMFCTYMILVKYQTLIQQLGRQNDELEKVLGERISELEKANEAMRLELAARKRGE